MTREIPLDKGFTAIVDDEDYDSLSVWKWHAKKSRDNWYAARSDAQAKCTVRMHRSLMNAQTGTHVHHANGNTLDNRRSNLKTYDDPRHHLWALDKHGRSTSRYLGVQYRIIRGGSSQRKWFAAISLGYFDTEEAAARSFDIASILLRGPTAPLNFPKEQR